jgi:formate dehydrogenase iron-sulfur subunit
MKKKSFINRRQFIKAMAGLSVASTLGLPHTAGADTKQFGKLADTFRCIGCKRCMSACKRWNSLKVERDELVNDKNTDLNGNNWVVVNLRSDKKNKTQRNYMHWACQICQEPACAGVCPVSAIK